MADRDGPQPADASRAGGFTFAGVVAGVKLLAPMTVFVVPFGLAFGLAAIQRGLDPWVAILMSAAVLGGASQFAVLDLWAHPLPIAAILVTTGVVNARHLLYGAALYDLLAPVPPGKRYLTVAVMTDIAWTSTMDAVARGERDAGVLLGGGFILWLFWVLSTAAGAYLAAGIGDPRTYGLDIVLVAFFAASLVGLWRGRSDLVPWVAAAVATLAGLWFLPTGWHVIVGALAGGLVGVWTDDA